MPVFRTLLYPALLIAPLCFASCSKDNDAKDSKLEIRLTDAPGDFRSVVLDVRQIEVHTADASSPDGWHILPFQPQSINVVEYVNGKSALLTNTDFSSGNITEIRLMLGADNYVIGRDGQRYDLKTPSGQTSGIKLKLNNATLRDRETYQLLLDFDVAKSIVERGNWNPNNEKKERYLLKPVIRVIAQDIKGSIRGTVTPAAAQPQVLAIRSSITVPDTFSTAADASGAFQLSALPSGTYHIEFYPTTIAPAGQAAYRNITKTNIRVENNQTMDLGSTKLN
jgi:Domain of unknown function (DUF4382)